MGYNLKSPNGIHAECNLAGLEGWFSNELTQASISEIERRLISLVAREDQFFVRWASKASLLWEDCDRVPESGRRQKYFSFPDVIKLLARGKKVRLDTRANGPAVVSFLLAGGERPKRFGSSNEWSIHHLYSGKFPYAGRTDTTHAAKHGLHFTQSAGLVAVHPVADSLVDEFPCFAWFLRAKAFLRFGYDPDHVFSPEVDHYGFERGRSCHIEHRLI
jgi:hypothetical protein